MTVQNISPEPSAPNKKFPFVLLFIAIIAILALLGGYFLYQNSKSEKPPITPQVTEDPTKDWVLFNDVDHHLSLRHPKSWQTYVGEEEGNTTYITNYDYKKAKGIGGTVPGYLKISINSGTDKRSLRQIAESEDYRTGPSSVDEIITIKDLVINSYQAIKVETKSEFGLAGIVFIKKQDTLFTITGVLDYEANKDSFDLIISTIKIIN